MDQAPFEKQVSQDRETSVVEKWDRLPACRPNDLTGCPHEQTSRCALSFVTRHAFDMVGNLRQQLAPARCQNRQFLTIFRPRASCLPSQSYP